MKKNFVWVLIIFLGVSIGYIGHRCDRPSQTNYNSSSTVSSEDTNYSTTSNTSRNTCSYCGKGFTGKGYNYALGECHQGEGTYYSKCSMKCCSESLQNDSNLSSKWK